MLPAMRVLQRPTRYSRCPSPFKQSRKTAEKSMLEPSKMVCVTWPTRAGQLGPKTYCGDTVPEHIDVFGIRRALCWCRHSVYAQRTWCGSRCCAALSGGTWSGANLCGSRRRRRDQSTPWQQMETRVLLEPKWQPHLVEEQGMRLGTSAPRAPHRGSRQQNLTSGTCLGLGVPKGRSPGRAKRASCRDESRCTRA